MQLIVCIVGFLAWLQVGEGATVNAWPTWPPPPQWTEKAKMARYLVHYGDWGVVATRSADLNGVPFGLVQSFCDGTYGNSTGRLFFYIAEVSTMYKNMKADPNVSVTITQAESSYCSQQGLDPELPTCARVTLTGLMTDVHDKEEREFAMMSLFTRHPDMKTWPKGHGWDFYKLKLNNVFLLDYFGGATHVPLEDYFEAKP